MSERALNDVYRKIVFVPKENCFSVEDIFEIFDTYFSNTLEILLKDKFEFKLQFILKCVFVKNVIHDNLFLSVTEIRCTVYISHPNKYITHAKMLSAPDNQELITTLIAYIEAFQNLGSNWVLESVEQAEWKCMQFKRMQYYQGMGASGDVPRKQRSSIFDLHALINVKNKNANDCFKWAVLSIIHYPDVTNNRHRVKTYDKWKDELNFDGCTFPFTMQQVKIFERKNKNIAINIFAVNNNKKKKSSLNAPGIKILKQCSSKKGKECKHIVNILKYKGHYYGIVNISRLLNSKFIISEEQ